MSVPSRPMLSLLLRRRPLMSFAKKSLVLSSLIILGSGGSAFAGARLSGAGASFPAKIYTRWFSDLAKAVSYTHLRAHETREDLVCRLLLEKKKRNI